MKIVSKPIGMIATFQPGKEPRPYKFSLDKNGTRKDIKIDSILDVRKSKIAGINTIVYRCKSVVDDKEIIYELKYTIATCQWVLYKI